MALTIRATEQLLKAGVASPMFGGSIPGLSYLGLTRRRTPYQGQQWVLTFESWASNDPTIASPCETAFNHITGYFAAEVESVGPKHTLRVYCPDDPTGQSIGEVITTFELVGNEMQKDLREHPKALLIGPDKIDQIEQVLQGKRDFGDSKNTFQNTDDGIALYDRLRQRNGNAFFAMSQFVFKYNRVASNLATIDVGYANVNKVLSTAQMIAETGPPSGILTSIADAEAQFKAEYVDFQIGLWKETFSIGWIKKAPTVVTTANYKIQVSGEYWLENWDLWIYGKPTA